MNRDIVKGHWKEIKGKLKKQWSKLTEDPISHMEGTYKELEGIIQKSYGYQKEHIKKEIESFLEGNNWKD